MRFDANAATDTAGFLTSVVYESTNKQKKIYLTKPSPGASSEVTLRSIEANVSKLNIFIITMEPDDATWEHQHKFFDQNGGEIETEDVADVIAPFVPKTGSSARTERTLTRTAAEDSAANEKETFFANEASPHNDNENMRKSDLVHSVLLAHGIHHRIDDETLACIPTRYEKGSTKAKLTWFGALCMSGLGMFVEAYVIVTTGQVKTIWHDQYPECWGADDPQHCPANIDCCGLFPNTPTSSNGTCLAEMPSDVCTEEGLYPDNVLCSSAEISGVSYASFAGIMAGMLFFGAVCDIIGRKNASVLTSLSMLLGISGMTFFKASSSSILFIVFSVFFSIFGLGVGGEYPLTASGAAENDAAAKDDALHESETRHRRRALMEAAKTARRGETIALVFAMQGLGAVFGSIVIICLVYFADQSFTDCLDIASNSSGNDPKALDGIWRGFYFIGLCMILPLLLYRGLVQEEGGGRAKLLKRKERRAAKLGKKNVTFKILKFYSLRLIGTGGCWMMWDVAFYGLKLFSGPIFDAINPSGNLLEQNAWLLVNNICALAGYYAAAAVIDKPIIGRKRLQNFSFIMCALLFYLTAGLFYTAPTPAVMFLYFASSFFGNFGSNVTTYVMAAETYPTEIRATCHGLSAFLGKFGALVATIVFGSLRPNEIFWVCGSVSIAGLFFSFLFACDLTHVSLHEHDAQLELFLEGRPEKYKGKLNDPAHLSNFERWTGNHGEYDPDWGAKIVREEMESVHPSSK